MMTSSPSVAPQESEDRGGYWRAFGSGSSLFGDSALPTLGKLSSGEISSSVDDLALKVRKPYTITKQRERWTEEEHTKFLEALKLYGRAWRRIEEHIGTKTAVQIRSHAQKFFSKLEREATAGGGTLAGVSQEIDIPPPRPKRKPSHPYPRKAGGSFSGSPLVADEDSSPPAAVSPLASKSGMSGDGVAKPAEFSPYSMPKPAPLDIPSPAASQPSGSPASLKLFGQTVVVPTAHMAAAARSSDVQTTIVSRACVSEGACETSEGRMQSGKDGKFLLSAAEARFGEKCGTRRLPAGSNVELLESGISVLEGGSDSNAATRAPHRGETSQSERRDLCCQDSAGTSARSGEMSTPEGPYDYSQYRGTATVAHHLAAALNAGMHLHNMSAMPDKPPFTLMDFAALHPARFMAGFPGLPGLPAGAQHAAFNLESLARMTPWHTGAERPAFPTGVWPGLIPGATAPGLPVPMGIPLPSGMPRLRPGMECVGGQDDGGAAAAVAAATIAAASAWWALQGSVPPGVVHPGMAAMYNPSAAAAAVASVTEAVVVQNCRHPSRSSDHRGQQPEPEDEQQVGSNDSEDGVAGDSPARKSSAVKRAERASRMREQKARRGHFSAHAVCTDSSPGWGNSSRSTRAGSFCESSAFPGWMKIKGDKMGVNQKDVDKRPSPSSCNGDGVRKRARVRSMSGSNTPPGEGRHSDDGDKSGDERQPSSSDGSGSEAGDPPVGGSVRGRSSNSSGCGNTQGEGGRAAFFDGGSSDGEEMPQSRSPEEGGDNAVQSAHHGHSPVDKPQTGTGESNKQNEKITSSAAEQWRIEFDRVPTEEHLASQGPSGKEGSPTSVLQRLGSGDATPSSSPNTDCQSSHGQRNGGTARASDASAPTCGGSHSQGGLRTGTTLNEVQETVSASREKDEEEASSLLETRKDQDRTLESNSEQDRDLCPSPDAGDAAAASQDDAAPKFQGTRGIDSNAEAHLQRLSMLRMCPTSASSCGSPRFSGIGFVPYQRTSTEASGTDSPGSKGERLHLRTEDACNFEGQSWRQKRPCTREEPAQA